MERIHINQLHKHIGKEVYISGWVHIRRDHGKLIFIDLRDAGGKVQMVVVPTYEDAHKIAETVRPEWVIGVKGIVNERPEKMVNQDEENGDIELKITELHVINESLTPPFDITEDTSEIDEATRLQYRYLDLRTSRMQKNIKLRSEFIKRCRDYLFNQEFDEIETPLLTRSTPEGSRDFVVPSRLHPGKFYALPQSPQQYKQLLMNAGFERYFQVARCIRDEDLRADRGFEHTQIDIEMSFVEMENILHLIEDMITQTVESMGYTIKTKPFPRIDYDEALRTYGADKFDMREEGDGDKVLAYAWVVNFPFFEKTDDGNWTFTHNPFSMPLPEHIDWVLEGKNIEDIKTQQYDLVCNGYESGGGSIRSHRRDVLEAVYKIMGYSQEEIHESIGHILEAFQYGTPPHGGIALGVERNIMNLTGEEYLREVQTFPMTRGGNTAVMNAPTELTEDQLSELHIDVSNEDK